MTINPKYILFLILNCLAKKFLILLTIFIGMSDFKRGRWTLISRLLNRFKSSWIFNFELAFSDLIRQYVVQRLGSSSLNSVTGLYWTYRGKRKTRARLKMSQRVYRFKGIESFFYNLMVKIFVISNKIILSSGFFN